MKINESCGISVVELLIVLSVMSITTAVTYPRISDYLVRIKLDGAVQILTFDLLLARQEAVSRGSDFVVNFETGENQYFMFQDEDGDRSRDSDEYMLGPRGVPDGVVIDSNTFENSQAVFRPTGKATTGQVTLSNDLEATHVVTVYYTGAVNNDL